LIPCSVQDPFINKCLNQTFNYLLKNAVKAGIQTANIPRLDRFYVEDTTPIINDQYKIYTHDVFASGFDQLTFTDVRSNLKV
jgi:hypothetical protein